MNLNELRESLVGWAVLGVSFVGEAVLDVVTDARIQPHLTVTLKQLGIIKIKNFDIHRVAKKKEPTTQSAGLDMKTNIKWR